MSDNNDDNVVNFPTQQRKQAVKSQREGTWKNFGSPSQPGQDLNITFNFDTPELSFSHLSSDTVDIVVPKTVSWLNTENVHAADDLSRVIDLCSTLQKNSAQQALKGNSQVLGMILDKLAEAISISKMTQHP